MGTAPRLKKDPVLPTSPSRTPSTSPLAGSGRAGGGTLQGPGGSVRPVMGMGGAGGPDAERRRRLVATLVVLALLVTAAATVLSITLG